MADTYDRKILNALLDSYENSLLSRGENKIAVHITFRFTKRSMPVYFDESSQEYEKIHACLYELEQRAFLTIQWKDQIRDHIVEKVTLDPAHVDEVYQYLGRTPKALSEERLQAHLGTLAAECGTPAATAFIRWARGRLEEHLSLKEYFSLSDPEGADRLIRCVYEVEKNNSPCYVREFSIRHFSDSKAFEEIRPTVRKVLQRFGGKDDETDEKALFAEYGIYDTPDYVYLKGRAIVRIASEPETEIRLDAFRQGIGISGEDLDRIRLDASEGVTRVVTIENLTAFFRFEAAQSLVIYLGGYHNQTRRFLLQMIYSQLPEAQYLHFGDIDAGGFEIYEDLCRKTKIPFRPWHMGVEELVTYRSFAKALTENDKRRLQAMLERDDAHSDYRDVLTYMLSQGIKLEQECIDPGTF